MRQLRDAVVVLGSRLNPGLLVVLVVALNAYWLVILAVINREFQGVTNGHPLLDLQNSLAPGEIITPARVLEQLGDYTPASRLIYWIFFMLDNIMPHLAFGFIALLWVYFWRSNPNRLYNRLLGGYAVLIPLGGGFFDWLENLSYLVAIHAYPAPGTVRVVVAGLTFKWLKAACVFPSTLLVPVFLAYHLFCALQRRRRRSLMGS